VAVATCAIGVALLAPAGASACPAGKYCTDANGVYELIVPSLEGPVYGPYRSCVWEVHVDFGDGTKEDLIFEGEKGITRSHKFPSYGTYTVRFMLTNGMRTDANPAPCPNYPQEVTVLYQSPAEIAEEAARLKAEQEAREQQQREKKAAEEAQKQKEKEEREAREKAAREKSGGSGGSGGGSGGSGGGSGGPGGGEGQPGTPTASGWKDCGGKVSARGVACPKAHRVIRKARPKLDRNRSARVLGFSCHAVGTSHARIACRRGKSRVLGPL
jgi:hypothetical protein